MKPLLNLLGEEDKKSKRQLEAQFVQKPFARHLRQVRESDYIFRLNPDLIFFEFTSLANTHAGSAHKGKIMKDMGVRAGWFDLTFIWRFKGQPVTMAFIECKYGDGDYSSSQKEFAKIFQDNDILHAKIHSPAEGFETLRKWGVKA